MNKEYILNLAEEKLVELIKEGDIKAITYAIKSLNSIQEDIYEIKSYIKDTQRNLDDLVYRISNTEATCITLLSKE